MSPFIVFIAQSIYTVYLTVSIGGAAPQPHGSYFSVSARSLAQIHERGIDSHDHPITALSMRLFRGQASSHRLPEPRPCAGTARPRCSSPSTGPSDLERSLGLAPSRPAYAPGLLDPAGHLCLSDPSKVRDGRPPSRPASNRQPLRWLRCPQRHPPHRRLPPHRDLEQKVLQPRHLGPVECRPPPLPPQLLSTA